MQSISDRDPNRVRPTGKAVHPGILDVTVDSTWASERQICSPRSDRTGRGFRGSCAFLLRKGALIFALATGIYRVI